MRRHGTPIDQVNLRTLQHGIEYSMEFLEYQAAAAANLDLWRWEQVDGYPRWFKAKVMAWYQLEREVEAHLMDASRREAERRAKTKGKS